MPTNWALARLTQGVYCGQGSGHFVSISYSSLDSHALPPTLTLVDGSIMGENLALRLVIDQTSLPHTISASAVDVHFFER